MLNLCRVGLVMSLSDSVYRVEGFPGEHKAIQTEESMHMRVSVTRQMDRLQEALWMLCGNRTLVPKGQEVLDVVEHGFKEGVIGQGVGQALSEELLPLLAARVLVWGLPRGGRFAGWRRKFGAPTQRKPIGNNRIVSTYGQYAGYSPIPNFPNYQLLLSEWPF